MMIVCVGELTSLPPLLLISGLVALSAVLALISKDTVQGSVAGTQRVTDAMIRLPEQLGVKQDGADGDVIKITLHPA